MHLASRGLRFRKSIHESVWRYTGLAWTQYITCELHATRKQEHFCAIFFRKSPYHYVIQWCESQSTLFQVLVQAIIRRESQIDWGLNILSVATVLRLTGWTGSVVIVSSWISRQDRWYFRRKTRIDLSSVRSKRGWSAVLYTKFWRTVGIFDVALPLIVSVAVLGIP